MTGGGSGFGEAISHAYVKEGANVLIGDFVVDSGKRVEADIAAKKYPGGASAVFVEQNVTKKDDWVKALDLAKSKFGKLDIVVNNAGVSRAMNASVHQPVVRPGHLLTQLFVVTIRPHTRSRHQKAYQSKTLTASSTLTAKAST